MKYISFAIIISLLFTRCKEEQHTDKDRELVVKYLGFKKRLDEKYYKLKNKKNGLGDDILDGTRIIYYESGRINGIENYNNGLLDGWAISYDHSGNKISEELWEANFRNEKSETIKIINYGYYEDGRLATIDICDKTGKVVSETSYDRNGNVIP